VLALRLAAEALADDDFVRVVHGVPGAIFDVQVNGRR
jgi:hypothetical protein